MATVQSMNPMLPASQPSQPSQTPDSTNEPGGSRGFGRLVEDAQDAPPPQKPTSASAPADSRPANEVSQSPIPVISHGRIQHLGEIELIVGESDVSAESLVEFMRSQGFSIGDAKQVLGLQEGESVAVTNELGLPQKFQKGHGVLSLSQALLNQIMSPASSDDTFFIHEIVIPKHALGDLKALLDQPTRSQQMISDLLNVFDEGMVTEAGRANLTGSGMSHEEGRSNAFSQSNSFARQFDLQSSSQSTQNSDFRSMIADFLRRSDNLQQLSDRMGQMMAARMAGQIGRGQWSLEMALHPAELGRIEIDMEMTERGLEAQFRTTQSVTRDLLLESMPRLKAWFEEGGINVASTLVDMGFQRNNGENPTARDEVASRDPSVGVDEMDDGVLDPEAGLDGQHGLNILV
ncbi:MAG: flagellar hook-length control protein FliK [Litorivicinaceae bacterium]|jgi:hypothetical protein|nr:flagellar hook-length control protein FliK [Litorivicinaceae bacterium]MDP5328413.1 flagellar hook-length control protein FliK [Litorivicinaceae bacterium]MDP5330134.1 flagellar hook-length control protein FliK [Litorivicinaceae bacterium]MDP5341713.1 flagellar hook-length control protein FliK [Litorivicinaceae bacterium]MDP5344287.1 flagellar hook-length control protein FliK [Litorivicinaceae bacterium]